MQQSKFEKSNLESYPIQTDEIHLRKLVDTLLGGKLFIFGFTAIVTLLAFAYVLTLPPLAVSYIAKTTFKEPSEISVLELNKSGHLNQTATSLHSSFLNNINKDSLQKKVFDEVSTKLNKENESISDISIKLGKDVIIDKATGQYFRNSYSENNSASIEGSDSELLIEALNELVVKANNKTVSDFFKIVEQKINLRLEQISSQRQLLLERARRERLNEIEKLNFAAKTARSLGIIENNFSQMLEYGERSNLVISIGENQDYPNWYLYGETALLERAKNLENRKDDSPYISSLINLDLEKTQLETVTSDSSGIVAMELVHSATSKKITAKSQDKRIITAGFFGGFLISILLVLLMSLVKKDENIN